MKCSTFVGYGMFIHITEFFIFLCSYVILSKNYLLMVYAEQLTSSLIISPDIVTASEKTTYVVQIANFEKFLIGALLFPLLF